MMDFLRTLGARRFNYLGLISVTLAAIFLHHALFLEGFLIAIFGYAISTLVQYGVWGNR